MKRSINVIWLAMILLMALAGCRQNNNNLTEDAFKEVVEKQFNMAKQKVDGMQLASLFTPPIDAAPVLFSQSEQGNAAELYWPVFKDRIDGRSAQTQQLIEQTSQLAQVLDLAVREKLAIAPGTIDVVKTDAESAAKLPELEQLEKGAQRKNCRFVGAVIPIPDNILSVPPIPATVVKSYCVALMAKALLKEAAGDKATAEMDMQTIVALGQHISQDANYINYFTGQSMMQFGCLGLKFYYQRAGNAAKQQAAEQLDKALSDQSARMGQLTARDDSGQPFNVLNSLGFLDGGVDTLARIAADENLPAAFRAKAIENLFSGYMFRYFMVERSGKPAETSNYDAPSDARIKALDNLAKLPDKSLAEMAGKSEQVLVKIKPLPSGERMKYWREISKAKS
jgi:hypothetical protein